MDYISHLKKRLKKMKADLKRQQEACENFLKNDLEVQSKFTQLLENEGWVFDPRKAGFELFQKFEYPQGESILTHNGTYKYVYGEKVIHTKGHYPLTRNTTHVFYVKKKDNKYIIRIQRRAEAANAYQSDIINEGTWSCELGSLDDFIEILEELTKEVMKNKYVK